MSISSSTLNKIKLLINLSNSPIENEAIAARTMADKLIEKYGVTEADLEAIKDKKPAYGDEEKLYSTLRIESWRNQLALGICTKFDCFLVQEESVPIEGISSFSYFVCGDPEDVGNVKFTYDTFAKKIEELVLTRCVGKGPVFIHSYCEGVVERIKSNLDSFDLDIENPKAKNIPGPANTLSNGPSNLTKHSEKEKPVKDSINISSQSLIKDVMAYFKGINDGNRLFLQDIVELAEQNKEPEKLT